MAVCQNLVPLENIKMAGRWMFIPLEMVLMGIDPYPYYGTVCGSISGLGFFDAQKPGHSLTVSGNSPWEESTDHGWTMGDCKWQEDGAGIMTPLL